MAAEGPEVGNLVLPELTAGFLSPIVAEVNSLGRSELRHEELDIMAERNPSLKLLFANRFEWGIKEAGIDKAEDMGMGYFLAHRVLRLAIGNRALPPRSPKLLEDYVACTDRKDGRVLSDFQRDYEARPAVKTMVDDLDTNPQRYGARLLFAVYGGWANPTRKPILIPSQSTPPARNQQRRRSGISVH